MDTVFGGAAGGRQYSLVGDAELDEGAVWEAVLDPSVSELGEIVWIVDMNRQSLDRIVPNIAAARIASMFSANGWQVIELKFGKLLEALFERPGGESLQQRILDSCQTPNTNASYAAQPKNCVHGCPVRAPMLQPSRH